MKKTGAGQIRSKANDIRKWRKEGFGYSAIYHELVETEGLECSYSQFHRVAKVLVDESHSISEPSKLPEPAPSSEPSELAERSPEPGPPIENQKKAPINVLSGINRKALRAQARAIFTESNQAGE